MGKIPNYPPSAIKFTLLVLALMCVVCFGMGWIAKIILG